MKEKVIWAIIGALIGIWIMICLIHIYGPEKSTNKQVLEKILRTEKDIKAGIEKRIEITRVYSNEE